MKNLIRASMELAQVSDVKTVISLDAPKVSTNCESFIQANLVGYYILINTWLHIVKKFSTYGWMRLWDAIHRDGLFALIARASSSADEVVHETEVSDSLFRGIVTDIARAIGTNNNIVPIDPEKRISEDPVAAALFVLRYPKRFSPIGNDKIQQESIRDFLRVENDSKLRMRRGYSPYFIERVREEMANLLDWDGLCDRLVNIIKEDYVFSLPTGAALGADSSMASKYLSIAKSRPEQIMPIMGVPTSGSYPNATVEYFGVHDLYEVHDVDVRAVPKSYKAARIIAMEDPWRQAKCSELQNAIDAFLPDAIRIHDQTQNQALAKFGSEHGCLATVDLSHASDTITKVFASEVFPERFWGIIAPWLGTHTLIDGKRRLMQQMSTAGHSLTFILESMVFLAVYRAATRLWEFWSGETAFWGPVTVTPGPSYALPIPSIYGDDGIVDDRVVPTLYDMLDSLGFKVNETKSFYQGPYRESCGKEYWNGADVSGYYFPRFPLEGTMSTAGFNIAPRTRRDSWTGELIDSLTSLVSLQHRLYGVCYEASFFVKTVIKEAFPKMTMSTFGADNGDCWDYEDTVEIRYAPTAKVQYTYHPKYTGMLLKRSFKRVPWSDLLKQAVEDANARKRECKLSEEHFQRFLKFRPGTRFVLKREPSNHELRLFESYRYWQFLRFGPRYEDPLLELLGISAAPITKEQFFGKPEVIWSLKETNDR